MPNKPQLNSLVELEVEKTPSFAGLKAASERASIAARAASRKYDTRCELKLRRALWATGLRYRVNDRALPGCPDIVFCRDKVAVFCDGDFWHGRDIERRRAKLTRGTNGAYWTAKIERNIHRDRVQTAMLQNAGWIVLRFWESEIYSSTTSVVEQIAAVLQRPKSK